MADIRSKTRTVSFQRTRCLSSMTTGDLRSGLCENATTCAGLVAECLPRRPDEFGVFSPRYNRCLVQALQRARDGLACVRSRRSGGDGRGNNDWDDVVTAIDRGFRLAKPRSRCRRHLVLYFAFVTTTMAAACNDIFDIRVGKPQSGAAAGCVDPLTIDDLEDGDGTICGSASSTGRHGSWYTVGDGTSTDLKPVPSQPFAPELIPDGRHTSRYAAHMTGSRFTGWGAAMGFHLNVQGPDVKPYDASAVQGVRFWMKSSAPVHVNFPILETLSTGDSGTCIDSETERNCDNHFQFLIASVVDNGKLTAPTPGEWTEYDVPFTAAAQAYSSIDANGNPIRGSAAWNPAHLVGVLFKVDPHWTFDVWVDDVRFYSCIAADCVPTCSDPSAPVACPAVSGAPGNCWPIGTECSTVLGPSLNGVWGGGADDVWAVGAQGPGYVGAIVHWNGTIWSSVPGGASHALNRVWGSGPNDVWAVGNYGTIEHWDGSVWSTTPSGALVPLNGVWGNGPNDVWAVGDSGTIVHWNGSAWSSDTIGATYTLNDVWGSGPTDVWTVGYSGTSGVVYHCDGSGWSAVSSPPSLPLSGVWGSGPGDVWAVGGADHNVGSVVLHWDDTAWSTTTRVTSRRFNGVWGSGPKDIWTVGGVAIISPTVSAVTDASGGFIVGVGDVAIINPIGTGTTVHWSGTSWAAALIGAPMPLWGVWGSGPSDIWAVGGAGPGVGGSIFRWNGSAWTGVAIRPTP